MKRIAEIDFDFETDEGVDVHLWVEAIIIDAEEIHRYGRTSNHDQEIDDINIVYSEPEITLSKKETEKAFQIAEDLVWKNY